MSLSEHDLHMLDQKYGRIDDQRNERLAKERELLVQRDVLSRELALTEGRERVDYRKLLEFTEAVAYGHYDSLDSLRETAIALLQEARGGK